MRSEVIGRSRSRAGSIQPASSRLILVVILAFVGTRTSGAVLSSCFQDPVSPAALCDSATVRLAAGDTLGALALFERILAIDPDHPAALLGLGRVLLAVPGAERRALDYLQRAVERTPDDPRAHYALGLAHMRLKPMDFLAAHAAPARRAFKRTLELDPTHTDAGFRLGVVLRDYFQELDLAEAAFRRQIAAAPSHPEANAALLRIQAERGRWDEAVATGEQLLQHAPGAVDAYPYLAAAYWKTGRPGEAMTVFERYFTRVPQRERDLYFELGYVLNTQEHTTWRSLSEEGRRSYYARYWSVRDPDPRTDVNERLLQHFIRVAWARLEFGRNVWPWDARGDMYVRYGEPDVQAGRGRPYATDLITDDWEYYLKKRQLYLELGLSPPSYFPKSAFGDPNADLLAGVRVDGSATPIQWFYVSRGLQLDFEDPVMSGRYRLFESALTHQLSARKPVFSAEEENIQIIDPMDGVFTFKGSEGRTAIEYAFALLPDDFGPFRSATGAAAELDVAVDIYTPGWEGVATVGEGARRLRTVPQVTIRGIPLFVDATRLEVAPGSYRIATLLLDPGSGRRATAEEPVDVPDYSGSALQVSDILPAATIREVSQGTAGRFVRGSLEVLPLPGRALQSDQPLFIYYEVYNLRKDLVGATDYEVSYSVGEAPDEGGLGARLYQGLKSLVGVGRRRTVLTARVERSRITTDSGEYLQIDMSAVPAGIWLLELTVTDRQTGQSAGQRLFFRTLPLRQAEIVR
jgi:GWxTD domain-containing protein